MSIFLSRFYKIMYVFVCVLTPQFIMAQSIDPPYNSKMLRLADILGSVHFLRNLCGEKSSQWRNAMDELIMLEKPNPQRRANLIASFNHGYRSFDSSYTHCTDSAIIALNQFMREGNDISQHIALIYGN
jgi:uncharacterized protein (TIGR02301 family)